MPNDNRRFHIHFLHQVTNYIASRSTVMAVVDLLIRVQEHWLSRIIMTSKRTITSVDKTRYIRSKVHNRSIFAYLFNEIYLAYDVMRLLGFNEIVIILIKAYRFHVFPGLA